MRGMRLCAYLALMLVVCGLCQGRGFGDLREHALSILNRNMGPGSRQPIQIRPSIRKNRFQKPSPLAPKSSHGSRFALSLDVPTSILSALIDLAKNQEMRNKAAANAQLMARIGKRK